MPNDADWEAPRDMTVSKAYAMVRASGAAAALAGYALACEPSPRKIDLPAIRGDDAGKGFLGDAASISLDDAEPTPQVDAGTRLAGRVVDVDSHRPLSGRVVVVGNRTATTDFDGAFSVPVAEGRYDLVVMEPDRSSVSIYKELTRRNPVVGHRPSPGGASRSRNAVLGGNLSGGGSWPLGPNDFASVYIASPFLESHLVLDGSSAASGPGYGDLHMLWNGPATIQVELYALASFGNHEADGSVSANTLQWFSHGSATMSDRERTNVDLALQRVEVNHVSGRVEVPNGSVLTQLQRYYRLPTPGAIVPIDDEAIRDASKVAFDFPIPDLTTASATLCVAAFSGSPSSLWTERCDVSPGSTGVNVTLRDAPTLESPSEGDTVDLETRFSWTPSPGAAFHVLSLETPFPTTETPNLFLYTSETATSWPDLSPLGVPFPSGTTYSVVIAGWAPYANLDDAVGPDGVAAPIARESARSQSPSIEIGTR